MKKLLILFGGGLTVVVVALVILLAVRERIPDTADMTPKMAEVRCPFEYQLNGTVQSQGGDGTATWTVFISDYHGTAPKVDVSLVPMSDVPGATAAVCKLDIKRIPGSPLEGVDWRIGTTVDPLSARGKIAKASFRLRADREITLEAGQAYLYDGKSVVSVPVGVLSTEWRSFTIQHTVPADATAMELWLRLTIHGKISQTGAIYMTDAKLALD